MSPWWARVCLKLQSVFLIPTPCCFKIPSQPISASVLTSGSTNHISGCPCMLADLALLPPERQYKPNLLALLWTRLCAGDNRKSYSGSEKGWCLHCKTGDEVPGGRVEQWSLVLAWLSLLANRLLQGYFCVLHLQSPSQAFVSKGAASTTPEAPQELNTDLSKLYQYSSFSFPSSVPIRYSGFTWKSLPLTLKVAFDIDLLWAAGSFYHFPNSDGKLLMRIMITS